MLQSMYKVLSSIRNRGLNTTLVLAAMRIKVILELPIPWTIWGDRVGLRSVKSTLTVAELEQVHKWSRDEQVLQWSGSTPIQLTLDEFHNQLRRERWHPQFNQRVFYIVTRTDELIGRVGLFTIDWGKLEGELGILIAKEYWNKQYGRDAIKVILRYIWSETPLQRIYLNTATENVRAQRSFAACGFCKVGMGRRYLPAKGEYISEGVEMEILRRDARQL